MEKVLLKLVWLFFCVSAEVSTPQFLVLILAKTKREIMKQKKELLGGFYTEDFL